MSDYRLRARSAVPGDYNFIAGRLAFLPAAADVWNGVDRGDGTNGTKRASSITNCEAGNIKATVVIDDVTGTYGGGGVTDLPEIYNVLDTDTLDNVPGTYHEATAAEVKYGVVFGPASAYTGTYGQSALLTDTDYLKELITGIVERFTTVSNDLNTNIGGRLFLDDAPEGTEYPYVVFFVVVATPDDVFSKAGKSTFIQFSLFSNSPGGAEISTMYADLMALFNDCTLVITSNALVWFRWSNLTTMVEDHTTPNGTVKVKHYAVEYEVTTQAA